MHIYEMEMNEIQFPFLYTILTQIMNHHTPLAIAFRIEFWKYK